MGCEAYHLEGPARGGVRVGGEMDGETPASVPYVGGRWGFVLR